MSRLVHMYSNVVVESWLFLICICLPVCSFANQAGDSVLIIDERTGLVSVDRVSAMVLNCRYIFAI